jgi:hypothetical protein
MSMDAWPQIPDPGLAPLMQVRVELHRTEVGRTPAGDRREVTFVGTATSPHWSGERPVSGIDHIVVGSDGTPRLDVHAVVGEGDEIVAYRGTGRARRGGILEGVVFETACERLSWMNAAVAVGVGRVDGDVLSVALFDIVPG